MSAFAWGVVAGVGGIVGISMLIVLWCCFFPPGGRRDDGQDALAKRGGVDGAANVIAKQGRNS